MNTAIVWFRKIIRIHDNPMLIWAESSQEIDSIIPIYIIDENWSLNHENNIGVNRLNFLYDSLLDLDKNLKERYGTKLLICSGDSSEVIESIIEGTGQEVSSLLTDYCSEPKSRNDVDNIIENLITREVNTKVFPAVSTILDIEKICLLYTSPSPRD